MTNKLSCVLYATILYLPLMLKAQKEETANGIRWTENLTWEQVKTKAKLENKYIFLDCLTTWCGPCKKMDKEVYINDTVGSFFNDKFISVKVQMDKTKTDNEHVQRWYNDATAINKKYRIEGYPSYIFFSPEGAIVHKAMGYKPVKELIAVAQTAIIPGQVYKDPYLEYEQLVADYKQGIKHYDRMVYMIKTAEKFQENDLAYQLLNDHTDYAAGLKPENRYTKENIEFWASYLLNSQGKRFLFFYNDGDKIDKVMNKKGYSQAIVDRTIQAEIVTPFYKEQPGGTVMSGGMMMSNTKPDYTEANWSKLYKSIRNKYNATYAKRIVTSARIDWYEKHNNFTTFAKYYIQKLEMDGGDPFLNNRAFDIFITVTDKRILNKLIPWMEKAVKQYPRWPEGLDTYANLLYKAGRREEAILWEERALFFAKENGNKNYIEGYRKVIEQMKKGEPTYVNEGAIWLTK